MNLWDCLCKIINYLDTKFREPVIEEIKFQWGLQDEIQNLEQEIKEMQQLIFFNQKQSTCLAEVEKTRNTTFDLEDELEEFKLEMEILESKTPINFCEVSNLGALIHSFIKKAKLRLLFHQNAKSIKEKLKGKDLPGSPAPTLGEDENPMKNVDVVGVDRKIVDLQRLVEQPRDHMLVITVWGPGGSGKTTLVEKVYEKVQMNKGINCCAWINVKQSYKVEEVLRSMVKGFSRSMGAEVKEEVNKMSKIELQERVSDYLKQKRYVLVLDNVWDPEIFKHLVLPKENLSTVIVTSRQSTVALGNFLGLGIKHWIFKVKPLNRDLSWKLFCKVAFQNSVPPNDLIEKLGQDLVRRCNGLPLAILAIAQLMATKGDDPREWNDVLQDLDTLLQKDLARLNRVLLLSYYHLPTHLKYCFLYCTMLSKSEPVSITKLIRLWTAQGFVKDDGRRTLERIARSYFDELMNRSMLQFRYESKGFQMHDLLRDVALHMIAEEKFGKLLKENTTELEPDQQRLAIHTRKPNLQLDTKKSQLQLRSLLACDGREIFSSFLLLLQNIKLIRTLDLEGVIIKLDNVPAEVGDLIHLRYLSLRRTGIKGLPDTVSRLRHLQTLDVRGNDLMRNIPAGIEELRQLRHLLITEFDQWKYLEMPDITFKFTQLQSLDGVYLNLNQARQLKYTTELKKLNISATGAESWEKIFDAIHKMDHLRTLKLRPHLSSETLPPGKSIPQYIEKLTLMSTNRLPDSIASNVCLREIILSQGFLSAESFKTLGQLPRLGFLKLCYNKVQTLDCETNSFSELKKFELSYAQQLITWDQIPKGSMKSLCELTIQNCKRLQKLPDGLQELKNLRMLDLSHMPEQFLERLEVGGPDYPLIQHIATIKIKTEPETLVTFGSFVSSLPSEIHDLSRDLETLKF